MKYLVFCALQNSILFKRTFLNEAKNLLRTLHKQTRSMLQSSADDFFVFEDNSAEQSKDLTVKVTVKCHC